MSLGKIILVTGGARSGKSSFAENILKDKEDVLYIATSIVTDEEMKDRVKKHRERRNKNWETYEGYLDLHKALENSNCKYVLLDCVTIMTTNIMFREERDFDTISMEEVDKITLKIKEEINKFISKGRELDKTIVMVTNEVGLGLVPAYRLGRIFRDIAGFINQYIGSLSDEIYLVCCGHPLKIK
ncbi:adenosylcobinamide kinase/adenosylcobinamide-phosphate guanylyltransferase [Clostridium tetanomorphum]|uniref:Adenosylcobinamide kinase n=1 Tax=Clostridium tetanomorphum TaxID=1553 RepID=A0A923J1I8_CLOTT|nr:bifunctional adenosylcobinamide kinase/adenosylcobinamide-phosphate guanylyltransferase [Clostridium tetanomorphum]KAJ50329.1 adenosylcobinamide kinase/adenosylcobinamide-phosphate guanylyltransferase [Clostridium tetanomorphum DSM 665]MBC2397780.1 bifunctional adenosylcobinamide kinase/adenosylcobinamide-phosphate guanylyltransferase [Clostridium tetanomorphum]MBP1866059.1 adenosylcobinamide kinase/adenosylcobinamide-phosphate guanylyltransferase [Clostridium tetanomorphum]NRS83262.1 adenos